VGGAEFMTYGLIEGLLDIGRSVVVFVPSSEPLDASFLQRIQPAVHTRQLQLQSVPPRANRFVSEALDVPALARKAGAELLLMPNYFTPPFHRGLKTLGAILDLQYLHFPQFFSPQKRLWLRAAHELTLRTATRVSVISDFVRHDLLDRYGHHFESRVRAIPIGISWERFASPARPAALVDHNAPFILSVASHYSHKNLETLLRAFARLFESLPHNLVLVGQRRANLVGVRHGGGVDLESLAQELGIADRMIMTGHATDEEVGWCYQHADVFVFPSIFEGFGMPAVEALGFGLPVVTTRCGSLPEVTRGLAHLVNRPQDAEELAEAIRERLLAPEKFRPSGESIQKLKEFYAPARIAQLYLDAFES
jgi:glycosyltransferase involved in cell wall biosynthesis